MSRLARMLLLLVLLTTAILVAGQVCSYYHPKDSMAAVIVLLSLVIAFVAWAMVITRDARRQLENNAAERLRLARICPVCGYNLRATPERCPECGTKCDS